MSNLLDKSSILLTPTAYENGKILSVKPTDGTGDFDFTRNSSATRAGSRGLIEDITSNLPRIDYTGGTGHWLFEPQSTNKIIYSEDFTQWNKSNAITVTSNAINSPSGALNASLLSTTNTNRFIYLSVYSAANSTFSIYVKWKNGSGDIDLSVDGASTYTSVSVTSEWTRVSITPSSSISQVVLRIPTASELYVWGVQVEAQSFATSYIPTSGSISTRLQDAAFGAGSSDLINSTEGVLYAEIAALSENYTGRRFITLNDTTASNGAVLRYEASGVIVARYQIDGIAQCSIAFAATITNYHKIAFKYSLNDFALWVDGVEVGVDSSGNVLSDSVLNNIDFNSGNGTFPFFGKAKCVAVFKEALTDAELTCLTTI